MVTTHLFISPQPLTYKMPVRWNTERKADLIVSWERARKTEFQSQAELFEAVASRLDRLHGTVDFTPRACQDMWRNIYRQHWPGYAYAHNRDRAMTAYSGIYAFRFDRAPALGEAVNESLREARMPLLGAKLVLVSHEEVHDNSVTLI
jgi:hypothetical protein